MRRYIDGKIVHLYWHWRKFEVDEWSFVLSIERQWNTMCWIHQLAQGQGDKYVGHFDTTTCENIHKRNSGAQSSYVWYKNKRKQNFLGGVRKRRSLLKKKIANFEDENNKNWRKGLLIRDKWGECQSHVPHSKSSSWSYWVKGWTIF